MPKLNVQQNNQNVIQAFKNALAIGRLKGIIASDGNHNFSTSGSNDNLLDNAYFVGGGSQLGDGVFPINQRGQASYSANAYGIDRWICYGGAITLAADGISVPANGVFTQPTDNLTQLNGETLTLSVLYDSGIETGTATLDLSGTTMFINNGAAGQTYITNGGLVQTYKGTASKIRAMKLELGTVSTLPNDPPPDFGEELRKCQRYLWAETFGANTPIAVGLSFGTSVVFDLVVPVPMRKGATIGVTFTATPYFAYDNQLLQVPAGTAYASGMNGNHLRLQIGTNGADIGAYKHVDLLIGIESVVTVSCEL